jgi:hypothetical protein
LLAESAIDEHKHILLALRANLSELQFNPALTRFSTFAMMAEAGGSNGE